MKKVFIVLFFSFNLNLNFAQRQFLKGFGIFGAGTESVHHYKNLDENKKDFTLDNPSNFNLSYYYPQSHISREYFSWGAGMFAEFSTRDNIRWQTEFEYVKKGAQEKEVIDPFIGTRSGSFSANKYTYIQWNNYLKFYNPIGYGSHWYIMPGIRLEYLLSKSTSVFTSVSSKFPTFWFSGNVGLGYEFPLTKRLSGFIEYHWNPDILAHKIDNIKVRNRTFELRLGIVYRPRQRRIDDCNAPRYNGPAY
jgi:hypothetical protein